VLIDTGAGGQMGVESRLQASLRAAGVEPSQVTDILISHGHGDHIGGLVAGGALAFPNATIRISIPEWADLQNEPRLADLVRVITPKVQAFAPGSKLTPAITAVSLDGHTPGHSGFEIVSGGERLLYIGDALHSSVISVQRPEWRNDWDVDNAAAVATRQGLLERGASQTLRIYGVHFPFPGVGRFQRRDDGFVWVPER
jgi:glyoxylase-like metal-dependent hydrolase (beta-lactamase superfamily II)